jgi:uncharacterized protein YjbI with pentapeptide repeats
VLQRFPVRPATLQDYWRDLEDDLIASPDGQARFTRVHLPLVWKDGAPTGKADWAIDALDTILSPRLEAGAISEFSDPNVIETVGLDQQVILEEVDRRTQLQGAVLLLQTSHPKGPEKPVFLQAERAAFVYAEFHEQKLGNGTSFACATFLQDAAFYRASFLGNVEFQKASFLGAAGFTGATFSGDARFHQASFSGDARFQETTFSGNAKFSRATFSGHARFDRVAFSKEALFENAIFAARIWFDEAHFDQRAQFIDARFSKAVLFRRARFKGVAEFHGAIVHPRVSFDGATFDVLRRPLLNASFPFWALLAMAMLTLVLGAFLPGWPAVALASLGALLALSAAVWSALGASRFIADFELEVHIAAFRHLTLICEGVNNRRDAANFYALEMKAIRLRRRTNPLERFFSWAYDWAADYGDSIWRPFVLLALAIVLFAAGYWSLERGTSPLKEPARYVSLDEPFEADFVEAVRYSLSRVFPLGTWDDSDEPVRVVVDAAKRSGTAKAEQGDCSFRERLVAAGGCRPAAMDFMVRDADDKPVKDVDGKPVEDRTWLELHRTFIAMLSTLQTVFAGGLYFLFGLAVRRKFQII